MKILIVHNFYQIAGGEDAVMQNEIELLESNGHNIIKYSINNKSINSFVKKLMTMLNVPFSLYHYKKLKKTLLIEKPELVHVHNYFPLLSPSVFFACQKVNIPVVHTLHNYRAVCPTALLMHDGEIIEIGLKSNSWWAVSKKVYRNSYIGSFTLATMVELHKLLGTWQTKVDRFIALTQFAKKKYIEAGWPSHKLAVKSNFISDPFNNQIKIDKEGGYALYVGRLSEEKGIDLLLDAWSKCELPLKIVGDGPLKKTVEQNQIKSGEFLGVKDKVEVLDLIKNAEFVIMPSICYEGFPMVLVEAFACGTPALVARLGSMQEIINPNITGLYFETGNANDLAEKVRWLVDHPEQVRQMGHNARQEYLVKYTPEKNYEMLMDIYNQAIEEVANK